MKTFQNTQNSPDSAKNIPDLTELLNSACLISKNHLLCNEKQTKTHWKSLSRENTDPNPK